MICLYTYRKDPHNGTELRYSIRSMVKHFRDFTDALIVGHKPDWYTGPHLPYAEIKGKPGLNILGKINAAGMKEPFLWCADDHFALKPFDKTLPHYFYKDIRHAYRKQKDLVMKRLLLNCPQSWLSFIVHAPVVMTPAGVERCVSFGKEAPIRTLYCNMDEYHPRERLEDYKITTWPAGSKLPDRPFFSTHERVIPALLPLLESLYPDPSPYEL